MRLLRARVTNYKSIDDSGCVELDQVTCLVGKNESGKSAFLQALQKLSPIAGQSSEYDPVFEYPKKAYSRYKAVQKASPATVVRAEFELSDEEVQEIEASFGEGVVISKNVAASKNYQNVRCWDISLDEGAAVAHLISGAGLPLEVKANAEMHATITTLIPYLEGLDDQAPSTAAFLAKLSTEFEKGLRYRIANEHLGKYIPRFFYFDDYSIMRGSISIQALQKKVAADMLDASDRTFLALLALAGTTLEDLESESNYERMRAELEAAGIRISDEVFEFWSQNKQLAVEFDLYPADPQAEPPLNAGTILYVRIKNDRHRVTVPFSERSRGFVWFFSFLAYFSQLEESEDSSLVLLLDEPGLSLHAKAQNDFLRFIDERLAPKHQVIYTTHSPFLIEPSQLGRVRTVMDADSKGTVISADVLHTDRDTVHPLQAALGYELAQTLFVGPHNLLVEGSSDLIYLQVLSDLAAMQGKSGLDPRWVIVPVGGADKVSPFVSLYGANQLDIAVLMDISSKDQQRIQNLQAHNLLKQKNLIQIGEFTGSKEADIEDLFTPSFYLHLVNGTYAKLLPKPLALQDLTSKEPRIVKRLETHFKRENIGNGTFSHYSPAAYLLREQGRLPLVDDATIDRAVMLFDRLNALLPKKGHDI